MQQKPDKFQLDATTTTTATATATTTATTTTTTKMTTTTREIPWDASQSVSHRSKKNQQRENLGRKDIFPDWNIENYFFRGPVGLAEGARPPCEAP